MGKSTGDSRELLEYADGRKNTTAVSHCVTRVRFVLNGLSKADTEAIESLSSTEGTFTQTGRFRVVIGNEVNTFCNDFAEVAGIEGVSKEAVKKAAMQNQALIQGIMNGLAEIFAPLIPVIIVGGLILGLHNIVGEIALFDGGIRTPTQISAFQAGINSLLWLIGEAAFHFLPVCIVWSITRKTGATQTLGIVLGIALVSPRLLNAYSITTTAAAEIPKWNFGLFQVDMIGYQAQVLPAVLTGFTLVYLERFFRKICPAIISMTVVPFCPLLISVAVAHGIPGPIGWKIGVMVSDCVNAGLTSPFKGVFTGIFGFFYTPLVVTGLHHMSNTVDLQLIADLGDTALWPMIALSNIAQGSAVLAMILLQKNDAKAKEVSVPVYVSCYLDVTEPAMLGVSLKYNFPFICRMAGSAVNAVLSVTNGIRANTVGVRGIPDTLSVQPQYMGLLMAAIGLVVLIPFCLICTIERKKGIGGGRRNQNGSGHEASWGEGEDSASQPIKELKTCVSDEVIPMEDVPDQVSASGTLGDGVAVRPEDGVLRAPTDVMVVVVMEESLHACGLVLDNGVELLLHIGLDTVGTKGDGFKAFVKPGDRVRAEEELIAFDCEKIAGAGHSDAIIMVLTNPGNSGAVSWQTGRKVKALVDAMAGIDWVI